MTERDTTATYPGDSVPATEPVGYEVSPQQRHIWLLQRDSAPLTARIVLELEGALDIVGLQIALDKVVARHEILRTTFRSIPGRLVPVQVIHDSLSVQWQQVDAENISPESQAELIARVLNEEGGCDFNLETGPVVCATLLQLQPCRHMLALTLPSLCADSTSLQLLTYELGAFYAEENIEQMQEAPQYADLSDWMNQLVENESDGIAGHAYWKQHKFDTPSIFLPFEQTSDDIQAFLPASTTMQLDTEVLNLLHEASEREKISVSSLLGSGWQALMSRLSGTPDVLVYQASPGRTYEDLNYAIGPLVKWLPVQVGFEPSTPIERLWRRANRAVKEAILWEHYWNWNISGSDGVLDRASNASVGFQFEEFADIPSAGDLLITVRKRTATTESFKLLLSCASTSQGITLTVHYNSGRYAAKEIQGLVENYVAFLHSALQRPNAPIGALNLLSDAQREKILVHWNLSDESFEPKAGVHQLFEEAAQRSPEAVAVVFEQDQITYSELNARANQLAGTLIKQGVTPDVCVGLYLPRGIELIVGLLGILKAGGAYVPLDPALPRDRLNWMLADCGARLLVTNTDLAPLNTQGVTALHFDSDTALLADHCLDSPRVALSPSHLVYVIYTSGSTGRPKGVAIEHRNLLNYVQGMLVRLELPAASSYAVVSTIAADLGNTTVFAALCSGGCLHIISQECAMDSSLWRLYWQAHEIDCLKIVPSHLEALLGPGGTVPEMLPRRALVLGGEASSWELVHRIIESVPALRVFNHYGPTETTVGVLTYSVTSGIEANETGSRIVPLGRPLPNTRAYILNDYLQPVPVGAPGEIYIGGVGIGRGYLNQTALTSDRFVDNPYCAEPGARLYRTGDLACFLPDGNIEFIGRMDDQVKIRGYRIELGEIETVLLQHPSVRSAVVIAREDAPGDRRLVGYVVFDDGRTDIGVIREHLRAQLPEYMVPGALVELVRIPLTLNGKIDRKALPVPEAVKTNESVGPRNAVETVLAEIWEELLRRDSVSVLDSFFEIGGHSLLATQVISRVREMFQVDVPLRALFEAPSISTFGEYILLDPDTRPQIESMADMMVSLSGLSEGELDAELYELAPNGESEWR